MSKKQKPEQRIVHIHAKCDAFEVWEHIAENKAIRRLIQIRSYKRLFEDKLTVNTVVVNPTMF